jgi:hypothetical protein
MAISAIGPFLSFPTSSSECFKRLNIVATANPANPAWRNSRHSNSALTVGHVGFGMVARHLAIHCKSVNTLVANTNVLRLCPELLTRAAQDVAIVVWSSLWTFC